MPRTKGSKNKKSLTVDYAALIAEKQAEKDAAANEIAAVAANIEELKAELKSKNTAGLHFPAKGEGSSVFSFTKCPVLWYTIA